jgi:predicted aspartyl protease
LPPYPFVEFELVIGTWDTAEEALPDTGFDGGVVIPEDAGVEIATLADVGHIRLADGVSLKVPSWRGQLSLNGWSCRVEVIALGSDYLIGRDVLDRLEICFAFGREVRLRFSEE